MARLIRTEKEVEGNYTEQWVVVEGDDALEQWPEGPRTVVGRPAPRQDGHQRARGQALYTADLALPGMLHAAVLRSPFARARVKKLELSRALEAPGVLGAIGPDDCHVLTLEPSFHGAPVAAVAADTPQRARAALDLIDVEWEELEPLLDPEEAVRRESFLEEPRRYERGDLEAGLAEAEVVVEAEYRTQTVLHNSLETHQSVCRWEGDTLEVYISTQYIWGVRDSVAGQLGLPPDRVRVVCNFMGGGFGSKNSPGDYTYVAIALAGKTGAPVRCALTRREENLATGNRNSTIQRLRVGARSDGTLVALEGEFVNAVGWAGFSGPTYGPMEMLYACDNVRTLTYGTKLNLPPNAAFRAPGLRRGDVRAGVRARRARGTARARPARAAAAQPRRPRPRRRPAVLVEEPARVLPARGAALGQARRGSRELEGPGAAREPASRARSGTAAAGRPRTPGCVWARTDGRR